jgi:RTX calcium-binding nonapeptide repeat (4 copies)/FG-GAP-like repeat
VGSNADERIDVSTNGQNVGPLLRVFRNIDGATTTAGGIERIEVDALGGADIITVNDLEGTSAMEVVVDLAGTPNGTTGDGQRDRVNVNGETGIAGNAIAVEFNNGAVQVLGLDAIVTIEHAEAEDELRITTFGAADLIGASDLAAGHIRLSLFGGAGNDMLYGSQGDDTLEGGSGADQLIAGAGIDTASYATSGGSVNIAPAAGGGLRGLGGDAQGDTLFGIENIIGSAFSDDISGDDSDNFIDGGAGFDVLIGNGGNDRLVGGAGEDRLIGGAGDDVLSGDAGNDVIIGGAGTDTAIFAGNRANYRFNFNADGSVDVVDPRTGPPFAADTVYDVERLVFADGVFAPVAPLRDVVWRHSEGSIATATGHLGVVGTTWQTRGTGDFDGDGDGDVLWRHDQGQVVTWEMEGGNYLVNHNLGVVGTTWQIAGTGDFDGDGDADILWRHNDGMVVTWEMEDGQFVTNHNLPQVSTSFQIAGTGDFDGDGDADILWRGSAGQVVIWEMEGGALVTNHNLPQVPRPTFRLRAPEISTLTATATSCGAAATARW